MAVCGRYSGAVARDPDDSDRSEEDPEAGVSIEELARRHPRGRRGPHGTAEEREVRNQQIIVDWLRGMDYPALSAKWNLSERQLKEIIARFREHHKPVHEGADPIDIVYTMLDRYSAWISQLAVIADEADADSARVGAVNAQMSAQNKSAELMQATGLLPKNLGTLRLELDVRLLTQKLIKVLNDHEAPIELKEAIVEVLS